MSRPESPCFEPKDLPSPKKEDLDFENPPAYLKDPYQRIFWCLNMNVRDKILENWPQKVYFCFHKGFCTFQVGDDSLGSLAEQRIEYHFQKHPNHRISSEMKVLWEKLAKERRKMRDESKQKQNTFKSKRLQINNNKRQEKSSPLKKRTRQQLTDLQKEKTG